MSTRKVLFYLILFFVSTIVLANYVYAAKIEGSVPLANAVFANQTEKVENLLNSLANPDTMNQGGITVLMLASMKRNPDIVRLLLDWDAQVNIQSHNKKTALSYAVDGISMDIEKGTKIVLMLIKAGAEVNHPAVREEAVEKPYEQYEKLKLLMENGLHIDESLMLDVIRVNKPPYSAYKTLDLLVKSGLKITSRVLKRICSQPYDRESILYVLENGGKKYLSQIPLDELIFSGHNHTEQDRMKLLISLLGNGAALELNSPLLIRAYDNKWYQIINFLFNRGLVDSTTVNLKYKRYKHNLKQTLLMKAAQNGDVNTVKKCLEAGANINVQAKNGTTALIYAVDEEYEEVVEILLSHRSEVEGHRKANLELARKGKTYGGNALRIVLHQKRVNDTQLSIAKMLVENGASVECDLLADTLPVRENTRVFKMLVNGGGDVLCKTKQDRNLISDFMFSYGFLDKNVPPPSRAQLEAIKLVFENGIKVDEKYDDGKTLLIWAAERGYTELVELLLTYAANTRIRDNSGKTALRYAAEGSRQKIVDLIRGSRGIDVEKNRKRNLLHDMSFYEIYLGLPESAYKVNCPHRHLHQLIEDKYTNEVNEDIYLAFGAKEESIYVYLNEDRKIYKIKVYDYNSSEDTFVEQLQGYNKMIGRPADKIYNDDQYNETDKYTARLREWSDTSSNGELVKFSIGLYKNVFSEYQVTTLWSQTEEDRL